MSSPFIAELSDIAASLEPTARKVDVQPLRDDLESIETAATDVGKAWSGSNLGYHSRVYYKGLEVPPPGAHFSQEWGFVGLFQGTTGDWEERDENEILAAIEQRAGGLNIRDYVADSNAAREQFKVAQESLKSIATRVLLNSEDPYIRECLTKIESATPRTQRSFVRSLIHAPNTTTRDPAVKPTWEPAPHQVVLGAVGAVRAPYLACRDLVSIARSIVRHLERDTASSPRPRAEAAGPIQEVAVPQMGTKVFIGHGRSLQWRVLKDFVVDRLNLPVDEFNRVSVAGTTNIARLSHMLDNAAIAFLVMTAEDEAADGTLHARANVIHEAGLFQGRLGFEKAIVLLEDGCSDFSNIDGLGQIRFPKGNIGAAFEDIRMVLEREGLVGNES